MYRVDFDAIINKTERLADMSMDAFVRFYGRLSKEQMDKVYDDMADFTHDLDKLVEEHNNNIECIEQAINMMKRVQSLNVDKEIEKLNQTLEGQVWELNDCFSTWTQVEQKLHYMETGETTGRRERLA